MLGLWGRRRDYANYSIVGEREREIYIFRGYRYALRPPDQQPTELSQGYDETRRYLQYVYGYGRKGMLPGLVCYLVGSIVARSVRV